MLYFCHLKNYTVDIQPDLLVDIGHMFAHVYVEPSNAISSFDSSTTAV